MSSRAALLLVLLSVGQLAAAGWSIVRHERILGHGTPYKLRTAPIDPADAFRGRYVQVNPSIGIGVPDSNRERELLDKAAAGEGTAWVQLTRDSEGFATAVALLDHPSPTGDYLRVERAWPEWIQPGAPGEPARLASYRLTFAFDRYYMNERVAPAAERRFVEALGRGSDRRAWLVVHVLDGAGVIDGLFIDGVPIEQVVGSR